MIVWSVLIYICENTRLGKECLFQACKKMILMIQEERIKLKLVSLLEEMMMLRE
jgi:hypothetical protein